MPPRVPKPRRGARSYTKHHMTFSNSSKVLLKVNDISYPGKLSLFCHLRPSLSAISSPHAHRAKTLRYSATERRRRPWLFFTHTTFCTILTLTGDYNIMSVNNSGVFLGAVGLLYFLSGRQAAFAVCEYIRRGPPPWIERYQAFFV